VTREHPGRRLAQALRFQGLNQSQIAERIGVASPTISRLIAGKQALTQVMAVKLAAQTGVRVCWLLTGELPVYPDHEKRAAVEEAFAAGWQAALASVEQQVRKWSVQGPKESSAVSPRESAAALAAAKRHRQELEALGLVHRPTAPAVPRRKRA
jgi:transcriptional regulator with XRE-family HTH domain